MLVNTPWIHINGPLPGPGIFSTYNTTYITLELVS